MGQEAYVSTHHSNTGKTSSGMSALCREHRKTSPLTASTTRATTPPVICAGQPRSNSAQILERVTGYFSRGKNTLRSSLVVTLPRFLRARLLALHAKVSQESRLSHENQTPIPVFDLVNAGPRHRFCTAGKLVSNCLGLGYGCGWEKFITVAKLLAGLDLTEHDAEAAERLSVDGIGLVVPAKENGELVPHFRRLDWRGQIVLEKVYGCYSREVVADFRAKNPLIVALWNRMNDALEQAANKEEDLVVDLPSGRSLVYRKVKREYRTFKDKETGESQRRTVFTAEADGARKMHYGARVVENCLAGDTEVYTLSRGWVPLRALQSSEMVWDGEEFVTHSGVICKGRQETIACHGLRCTPDHLFFDGAKFIAAHEAKNLDTVVYYLNHEQTIFSPLLAASRHTRAAFWGPNNCEAHRVERNTHCLGSPVRLWDTGSTNDASVYQGAKILFSYLPEVSGERFPPEPDPRHDPPPGVWGLAQYATALRGQKSPGLQELRGSGHRGVHSMERVFCFLVRHGANMGCGARIGSNKQRRGVFPRELSLDNSQDKRAQSPGDVYAGLGAGYGGQKQDFSQHPVLAACAGNAHGQGLHNAPKSTESVYDILNCGPRSRFVVRAPGEASGRVLIAHNCTQAVARDVFAYNMLKLVDAGIWVLWSVHDEAVCAVKTPEEGERARKLMASTPPWIPGLPVEAELTLSDRYKK